MRASAPRAPRAGRRQVLMCPVGGNAPAGHIQRGSENMNCLRHLGPYRRTALLGAALLCAAAMPAFAQEVTVLCNYEVDWCEAMKAAYEKTTGQKAVFIRRTDGESLAQIRAEKANPRADVYHAAESASAKALAAEGLLEAYKSPQRRGAARLGADDRRGEQVFPDADLHRRAGLWLQHRAPGEEQDAGAEMLEGSRQSGLQERDPDGESRARRAPRSTWSRRSCN